MEWEGCGDGGSGDDEALVMVAGLVCTLGRCGSGRAFYVQIKIIYALAGGGAACNNNNNNGSSNSSSSSNGGGGDGGGSLSWAKHCKQLK